MSLRSLASVVGLVALLVAGCAAPPPYEQPRSQSAVPPVEAPAQSVPKSALAPAQPAPAQPVPPPVQPKRQFHLGAAAAALVRQARQQAASGNSQLALSTVERALRIEPKNPLLWLMLGQAHQGAGQYGLAESMGHKALQLASGDPDLQSRAWRLIGDALRAQGRNQEADDAYTHADQLAAQ